CWDPTQRTATALETKTAEEEERDRITFGGRAWISEYDRRKKICPLTGGGLIGVSRWLCRHLLLRRFMRAIGPGLRLRRWLPTVRTTLFPRSRPRNPKWSQLEVA